MPVFDGLMAADGPGRFFAQHPAVYWLSLAGSGGAALYAVMRVGSPRAGQRLPWAAMALMEAGITVGMARARNSADGAGNIADSGADHAPVGDRH